jgi:hypothetical protein
MTSFFRERRNQGGAVGLRRYRRAGDHRPFLHHDNSNFSASDRMGSAAAAMSWPKAADPAFDLDRARGSGSLLDRGAFHETYAFILDLQVAAGLRREVADHALLRGIGDTAGCDCC